MFIIYDLVFSLVVVFYLPFYLLKGKFHRGFLARLGFLPGSLDLGRPVWIHAVSVGEAMVLKSLVEELKKIFPGKRFVFSSVTPTGNKILKSISRETDFVTYLPLDLSFIVRRVISKINPSLFLIVETEIWPNLISVLAKKHIPVVLLNGRISDASYKGYKTINSIIRRVLDGINLFCVQTENDSRRFRDLGVPEDKIKVTGNLKFDLKIDTQKFTFDYRNKLMLKSADILFTAGSTHAPEEQVVLDVFKILACEFDNLKLLIAPRHPQRAKEISQLASSRGFNPAFISEAPKECATCMTRQVFILDTIGELISFYSASDIVFVGGSLVKRGGHNILEPAALGKPVLFGPFMHNFRDIAELFLSNSAAIQVNNQEDLRDKLLFLLDDNSQRQRLASNAYNLFLSRQGAAARTVKYIEELVADKGIL